MISLAKGAEIFKQRMADLLLHNEEQKIICFYRKGLLFAFNFHTNQSYTKVRVPVPTAKDYELVLSSDDAEYGGQGLAAHMKYPCKQADGCSYVEIYLPARTALVFQEV